MLRKIVHVYLMFFNGQILEAANIYVLAQRRSATLLNAKSSKINIFLCFLACIFY